MFKEIRIENTNACGYHCAMCPREKQTRAIGYMSMEDFEIVLDRVGSFEGFFHLHGFGEPLLDRKLIEKMARIQQKFPHSKRVIYTTLGVRVKPDFFLNLVEAGLTHLCISFYGFNREDYQKIHGFDGFERAKENLVLLSEAIRRVPSFDVAVIKVPRSEMSTPLPVYEPPEKQAFLLWVKELGYLVNEWGYVHNYSDGRDYNAPNVETLCPVIAGNRKQILNITWDLSVIPCCFDYNATIRFGNLRDHSLEEIFSSPEYLSFVLAHTSNQLDGYQVCQGCEKLDYKL